MLLCSPPSGGLPPCKVDAIFRRHQKLRGPRVPLTSPRAHHPKMSLAHIDPSFRRGCSSTYMGIVHRCALAHHKRSSVQCRLVPFPCHFRTDTTCLPQFWTYSTFWSVASRAAFGPVSSFHDTVSEQASRQIFLCRRVSRQRLWLSSTYIASCLTKWLTSPLVPPSSSGR